MKNYYLGCDVGGTFTDFCLINDETKEVLRWKQLTTLEDPSKAIIKGIEVLSLKAPGFVQRTQDFIHGTTLVINAVIERKGAKTALITTKGFRDILEIGRELRYDNYEIFAEYPTPLIPRHLRREVKERILSDGTIFTSLSSNTEEAKKVVKELADIGVESFAVSFLHSYANPVHEKEMRRIISKIVPDSFVSVSSDILPKIKEYERTSTVVINAYTMPIISGYIDKIQEFLRSSEFKGKFYMMLSGGGVVNVEVAKKFPVLCIDSGPVGGVLYCEFLGEKLGYKDLLSFDMGGTTAKMSLVKKGKAERTTGFEVGRVHRFKKWSGLPIEVPFVDMLEIGAGGGSIAKISMYGTIQVGPESAGADPGPACYSRGGKEPTVSDANLVLGYLDPDAFLDRRMKLDKTAAERTILEKIAEPLGINLTEAARRIHNLVNENMASAAKIHIIEKGGDPKKFSIVAYGGAGPTHAYSIAKKLRISRIIIPSYAGVMSAVGFHAAPLGYEMTRTHLALLDDVAPDEIEGIYLEIRDEIRDKFLEEETTRNSIVFVRSLDLRYFGQAYEVNVPLDSSFNKDKIAHLFNEKYKYLYNHSYPELKIQIVNLKVAGVLSRVPFTLPELKGEDLSLSKAKKGKRKAYSHVTKSFIDFSIYDRDKLPLREIFEGPAIIEEKYTTIFADSDTSIFVDNTGTILMSIH